MDIHQHDISDVLGKLPMIDNLLMEGKRPSVFICTLGFEDRASAIARKLASYGNLRQAAVLLIEYPSGLNNNEANRAGFDALAGCVRKIESVRYSRTGYVRDLCEALDAVLPADPLPNVLFDVSACSSFLFYPTVRELVCNRDVDELAHAAKRDSVEYLLALLGPDRIVDQKTLPSNFGNYGGKYDQYPIDTARFKRVVNLAAENAGWGKRKLGKGEGMGVAVHRSFLTYVATVVRVQVDGGKVRIRQVDTAVDGGLLVNPDNVRSQFEGAAVFGTSLAMLGEITATNGSIDQSNFYDYKVCRMNQAPEEVNVHLVESDAPPAGVGEPGVPPFAPALCNAIFAATGKRIRELPISRSNLA